MLVKRMCIPGNAFGLRTVMVCLCRLIVVYKAQSFAIKMSTDKLYTNRDDIQSRG